MGCGSSQPVTPTPEPPAAPPELPVLVIVADFEFEVMGEQRTETRIHLYNLPDCKWERELPLPTNPYNSTQRLTSEFSLASHPTEPWLFVSGGTYSDATSDEFSPHIWKLRAMLGNSAEEPVQKVANLPIAMDILATHVHRHGNDDFLYVMGGDGQFWRLNLSTAKWEEIISPPYIINEVQAMLSADKVLYIVGPHFCLSFKEDMQDGGQWGLVLEKYPRGLHTILNDTLVTFVKDTNQLFVFADEAGGLLEQDYDAKSFFSVTSQMHCFNGKELLFTGIPRKEKNATVWKMAVDELTPVVIGHLEKCPAEHQAFLCYREESG